MSGTKCCNPWINGWLRARMDWDKIPCDSHSQSVVSVFALTVGNGYHQMNGRNTVLLDEIRITSLGRDILLELFDCLWLCIHRLEFP